MSITLDNLSALPSSPIGTDIIHIKTVIDGAPLDFKIDVNTFQAPLVKYTDIGNVVTPEIGKLFKLVDDGSGNAGLPAISGALLTNLVIPSGNGTNEGGVKLSDAINSGNDVNAGYAATPKAVRDVEVLKANLAGDEFTGALILPNNTPYKARNFTATNTIDLVSLNTSDTIELGGSALHATGVDAIMANAGSFRVLDATNANAVRFQFNADGTSTGIRGEDVQADATTNMTASNLKTQVAALDNNKLEKAGDLITGEMKLENNVRLKGNLFGGGDANLLNVTTGNDLEFSSVGVGNINAYMAGAFYIRDSGGTIRFTFNPNTQTSSGINSAHVSTVPTGNLSSNNVQGAINELDSEKLALSGGTLTGAITLPNNTALKGLKSNASSTNTLQITPADILQIGATTNSPNGVYVYTDNAFKVYNGTGVEQFSFNVDGSVDGIDAPKIPFDPSAAANISSTDVAGALNDLSTAVDTGGTNQFDGTILFENNQGVQTKDSPVGNALNTIKMDASEDIYIGQDGATPSNKTIIRGNDSLHFRTAAGTNILSVAQDGTLSGLVNASKLSFTPTGGIASSNVQSAIAELDTEKFNKTGGNLTGSTNLNNNLAYRIKNSSGTDVETVRLDASNNLRIGGNITTKVSDISTYMTGNFNIRNSSGNVIASIAQNGDLTGFSADQITSSAYSSTSATNVQAAIEELTDEKFSKSGGTITGAPILNNSLGYQIRDSGGTARNAFFLDGSNRLDIGATAGIGNIRFACTGATQFLNSVASTVFTIDANAGTLTGFDADLITFAPTGGISSTNVQAAIQELDTEKLGATATATNSNQLGGVAAASYLTSATAAATYLGINATATNSNQLGGVNAASYLTSATAASTYLGINATANNSNSLGGVAAASYLTEAEGDAAYLGITAKAADTNLFNGLGTSSFIKTGETAYNSDRLGNIVATDYARTDVSGSAIFQNAPQFNGVSTFHNNVVVDEDKYLRMGETADRVDIRYWSSSNDLIMDYQGVASSLLIRKGAVTQFAFYNNNGNFVATGNVTAYSDERVKENLEIIPNALDKVSKLNGYTFDRTDMDVPRQTGVIAQEVQEVLPEVVTEGDDGKLSVAYGNMVGLLIESIKELKEEIRILKEG